MSEQVLRQPPAPKSPAGFAGQIRLPGQRWRTVVEGADYSDTVGRLLEYADTLPGPHRDLRVVPIGFADKPAKYVRHGGTTLDFRDAGEATGVQP